jgi:predicted flap endonuclease-1-like 5' DNA nuclease
MANYKIEEIEGVGTVSGEKLRKAGVTTVDKLLEAGKTKKQRKELAELSGLSESFILKITNMADLFRIKGIGQEFSELLEAAGVDTVPELAQRKPENLVAKMQEVNEAKKLTRRTPTLAEVEGWVAQAKELPRVIEY